MALILTLLTILLLAAMAIGVIAYRELSRQLSVLRRHTAQSLGDHQTRIIDLNQRLVALETAPGPAKPPEDDGEPASAWQRQRQRAEAGEFSRQ